jgi:hypothetical protein
MLQERMEGIVEELAEVTSMGELKALWCFGQAEGNEYGDAACVPYFKGAVVRLRKEKPVEQVEDVQAKLNALLQQLEELKGAKKPAAVPIVKSTRKYKLLKLEVEWSTKPQVHAIMDILGAHAKPGDVLDEGDIVKMMVENEHVLQTKQGGKRIWDYYKGDHAEGLMVHGNVERI